MEAAEKFSAELGTAPACRTFGVSRASLYRRRRRKALPAPEAPARPPSHRALSGIERQEVLGVLHSERFVDLAPAQVAAALLDEDRYLCSVRTMYRILGANQEIRERRDQRRHPVYEKPELLATGPNQVWSWDITKLKGPRKWTYYYLYVILDIFSRHTVGWMVADRESSSLAKKLIRESCDKHRIEEDQLTLHADRGSSMKSKAVALLLSDLGVTKTHGRPHVSDDNPFSEAQFKTLKYRPEFPERFGCIQDARAFCRAFFDWYNNVHYHSGLNWLTPATVHYGLSGPVIQRRNDVLDSARNDHPERFVNAPRTIAGPPAEVWINPPAKALVGA
jgi:putative transposase